jgi:hypothetical protein
MEHIDGIVVVVVVLVRWEEMAVLVLNVVGMLVESIEYVFRAVVAVDWAVVIVAMAV